MVWRALQCAVAAVILPLAVSGGVWAQSYADVLVYYEPGENIDFEFSSGELFNKPEAALGGPGQTVLLDDGLTTAEVVSLGAYSDEAATGTNDRPPALVLGFSTSIGNIPGPDLLVVGNAPSAFLFYEPAFIEVASESDGVGATTDGWADETFYLIPPSNMADLDQDPRVGPTVIPYDNADLYGFPFDESGAYSGYADVTPGGDLIEIADAIDVDGTPVALAEIAYIRFRSLTDSLLPWGTAFSSEIDYVQVVPEPGGLLMIAAMAWPLSRCRRRRR